MPSAAQAAKAAIHDEPVSMASNPTGTATSNNGKTTRLAESAPHDTR